MNTALFVLSTLALILGPSLHLWTRNQYRTNEFINGFVFVVIGGLVSFDLIPNFIIHGGLPAIALLACGFFLPNFIESIVRNSAKTVHQISLLLGACALLFHSMLDGAALVGSDHEHNHTSLAISVILHRFSVGLALWWLLKDKFSMRTLGSIFVLMIIATFFGQFMSEQYISQLKSTELISFQALITGTVIHVLIHPTEPQTERRSDTKISERFYEGFGNLVGFISLFALLKFDAHGEPSFVPQFYSLLLLSAPALVLAFTLGGLMSQMSPPTSISWLNRGKALTRAGKGLCLGLPLSVCAQGVTPMYRSLIAKGLTPVGAIAFLIAGPELGIEALIISLPLLGGDFTLFRILSVITLTLVVSLLMSYFIKDKGFPEADLDQPQKQLLGRLRLGLQEGYSNLFDRTAPWILFGLLIAAVLTPFLKTGPVEAFPMGLDVLAFALLGIPVYVCASGATPVIAVLLAAGLSPGAALAFLLTGPAANIATFSTIKDTLGARVGFVFTICLVMIATALGLVFNGLVDDLSLNTLDVNSALENPWLNYIALTVLGMLFIIALLRNGFRHMMTTVLSTAIPALKHQH